MARDINIEAWCTITRILLLKYGTNKLEKLLTGEMCIEENKDFHKGRKAYIRDFKHEKTPFTRTDGHEISVELVLTALDDAANHMSYSNWHTDKFDRAGECVLRYCEEHKIPVKFRIRD